MGGHILKFNGDIWLLDNDCTFACETGFEREKRDWPG